MKQSQLFTKTVKANPKGETSLNAQLLERGGFIYKNSAGIYSFLPLGWRVMEKIAGIIREEMDAIGGQEMFMPALVEKKYLDATGRWDVEVGFEARGKKDEKAGFVLGWTHEEVLTEIVTKYVSSYRDLPFAAYQIQTKFRNEPRAKSGLLRGREFVMKDLYSFHVSEADLFRYYDVVRRAYRQIFQRCGLETIYTVAAGGDFTVSNTHEFQVLRPEGEDPIFLCSSCQYAENSELTNLRPGDACPKCGGRVTREKAIEVGNIFPLGTKYATAFNLQYLKENGQPDYVVMGSYGIGLSRVMGAIVEIHHDRFGVIWPQTVAPFLLHLLELGGNTPSKVRKLAEAAYRSLQQAGFEVLYDDRDETAGVKFADSDLLGIPYRLVVSEKTAKAGKLELKKRSEKNVKLLSLPGLLKFLKQP